MHKTEESLPVLTHIAESVEFCFERNGKLSQLKICFVAFFSLLPSINTEKNKQASTVDVETRKTDSKKIKRQQRETERVTRSEEKESQNRQVKNVSPGDSGKKLFKMDGGLTCLNVFTMTVNRIANEKLL